MSRKLLDVVHDFKRAGVTPGVEIGFTTMVSDALLGQVVPGFVTAHLAYKQKRAEERIMLALSELSLRQRELDWQMSRLDDNMKTLIKETVWPMFLDSVTEEQQQEKISFLVNGFESVVYERVTNEELITTYFDVLQQLRITDLHTLAEIEKKMPPKRDPDKITLRLGRRWRITPEEQAEAQAREQKLRVERNAARTPEEREAIIQAQQRRDTEQDYVSSYATSKLERLSMVRYDEDLGQRVLTDFGEDFLKFFRQYDETALNK